MLTKKEIKKRCDYLREKYTNKPDENRIIGYNAQKHLYNAFLKGIYKAYAFKMFQDSIICPSTQKLIHKNINFLYRTNTPTRYGFKTYTLNDIIKDIINVYNDDGLYQDKYLIEVYELKKNKKDKLIFKKLENLNLYFNSKKGK